MNILVTGGAGYIGSIITEELASKGHKVVVIDNLQSGHEASISPDANLVTGIVGSSGDFSVLKQVFSHYPIEVVIHTAASMSPTDSISKPKEYFQNNLVGSINLIETMLKHGINKIIFSSSGCVYGIPQINPVVEDCLKIPTTPYGDSKLMFERILGWYHQAYGLDYMTFRFFNVSGASSELGSDKPYNNGLIPKILRVALGKEPSIPVFGSDYPTLDGSCVRDYVHVKDIVQAHLIALDKIGDLSGVYNLGRGIGFSVLEVIEESKQVTSMKIPSVTSPRRAGDPAILVADISRAENKLGWEPQHSELSNIIQDTWDWMVKYPDGYKD